MKNKTLGEQCMKRNLIEPVLGFCLLGIVILAVPISVVIAIVLELLLSNIGIGLITFFIALSVMIVWLRDSENDD